ncbi:MAG: ABC transporter ATP-binding protein [bacterium]|nr:ABC transporter ATP-binding protein [bacterium]
MSAAIGSGAPAGSATAPLLSVRDLRTEIDTENGTVTAADGVSFDLHGNEVLAVVGESGCGKTMLALSILGLLPRRTGRITAGQVLFRGEDLAQATPERLREIRGAEIAMIFQDALTGLHPLRRVGDQIVEMIRAHERVPRALAKRRAVDLLDLVGIPAPDRRVHSFPHELSGGMRQRVMIAMAVALDPQVLIADEPTTALDVTVQAQVLETLARISGDLNGSILLITHDFGVVAGFADRVAVMYAGRLVEQGPVAEVYRRPRHPYTAGLLVSMPRIDDEPGRLERIAGTPPNLVSPPPGCRFAPRCSLAGDICREVPPEMRLWPPDGAVTVACHRAEQVGEG